MVNFINKSIIQKTSLITADFLALVTSLLFAEYTLSILREVPSSVNFERLGVAKLVGLLVIVVFWYQEQYVKRRPIWEELRILYKTIFVFALLHLGVSFLISHNVVKWLNILFWLFLLIILPVFRYIVKIVLLYFGFWQRNVYIVGTGENAFATFNLLKNDKLLGYNIIGFINPSAHFEDSVTLPISLPILSFQDLMNNDINRADTEIIFAVSSDILLQNLNQINILQSKYTFVSIIPDLAGLPLYGVELNHFFGNEQLFLRLSNNLGRRLNRIIKRSIDIFLSFAGILILLPLFVLVAFIIRFTTKGSIFFKHKRVGYLGKHFYCLKFQTMYPNSKQILEQVLMSDENARIEWERDFKLKNDPRVTKIGKFLRMTSLDELPQLFNVLMGEMSLVGPRPIIDEEISRYGANYYYYQVVRPGITGLWQISGRNDVDYVDRVKFDVWYVKNWSLWYDLVILFKTVLVVVKRSGAY